VATTPTLKVSIAFASDPLDTAPTWVDVSSWVLMTPGLQVTRGASSPDEPDDVGECTFTLSCRDRRFDPTHASGPYFGNLRARKQVKVEAVWSATTFPVFKGWVTGFPMSGLQMGTDYVSEVQAFDSLSILVGESMNGDAYAAYIPTVCTVDAWYRQADNGSWVDSTGHRHPVFGGRNKLTPAGPMLPGVRASTVQFNGGTYLCAYGDDDFSVGDATAVAFWITYTAQDTNQIIMQAGNAIGDLFSIFVTGKGTIYWVQDYLGVVGSVECTAFPIGDGQPHHVALTTDGTTISIYVDGILGASTTYALASFNFQVIGAGDVVGINFGDFVPLEPNASGFSLSDVLFADGLTAAEIAIIANLGHSIAIESTADRVARILDDAGWPSAWRDLTTDPGGTVSELSYGQSALAALQQVERSEQGRLFAARNGDITFTQRHASAEVTRSSTVQATFSDDGADIGYSALRYIPGDDDIRNDITVSNSSAQANANHGASQGSYTRMAAAIDTNLSTVAQLTDMANGLVFQRKDPTTRFDPMTVTTATEWATILGLELGDRIAIESTPMGVGSQVVQQALIGSIEWGISADGWFFTFAGEPIPANSFWILGTSLLGTGTVPGF